MRSYLNNPVFRKGYTEGVDKQPSNYSTGYTPPDKSKFKNLDKINKITRPGFTFTGPQKYEYPDFERLKQLELERKGQKIYLSDEALKQLFEIEIEDPNVPGRRIKVVLKLAEILLNIDAIIQALQNIAGAGANPQYSDQLISLLISALGRNAGFTAGMRIEDVVCSMENTGDILNDVKTLIINPRILRMLPLSAAVINMLDYRTFAFPRRDIRDIELVEARRRGPNVIFICRFYFWLVVTKNIGLEEFEDIIDEIINNGRRFDLVINDLAPRAAAAGP